MLSIKKMDYKEVFFDLVGYLMISIFLFTAIIFYFTGHLKELLWFSNHAPLIIGLALLYRNKFWLTVEVILGFVPELVWIIDFIYSLIYSVPFFGVISYLSLQSPMHYIISLQHLMVIPLAVICLWKMGIHKDAFSGAFAQIAVLWAASYLVGFSSNTNCVFKACLPILMYPAYFMFYPFLIVGITWVTYRLLLYDLK